jgi:hypothetical protein
VCAASTRNHSRRFGQSPALGFERFERLVAAISWVYVNDE